jgi:hypothetical protein
VARYTVGIKHNNSCQQSYVSLNILTLSSFYIYKIPILVKDEGSCITDDNLKAHVIPSSIVSMDKNPKFIIPGGRFYTKLPAHTITYLLMELRPS